MGAETVIVRETEPVTLVGGSKVVGLDITRATAVAPHIVAADGGADSVLGMGHTPKAVIGDFDSISDTAKAQLPGEVLHPFADQDSTDFDKCLSNITAPLIIGLGFMGARVDHQMAAFNTLVRHPEQRCILIGGEDIVFLCPPLLRFTAEPGTRVSLFPMGLVEGTSDGLRWPIGGISFAPDGRVGTSNIADGPVELAMTAPKMLVILPAQMFEEAAEALLNTSARW